MKLVRQSRLFFREGNSDKVYEVDLCEAGAGEFLVNFRYGRRGAALRDGTKTPFPESRAKAEQIFDDLVGEKTRKGYRVEGEAGMREEIPVGAASSAPAVDDPKRRAILKRLAEEAEGKSPKPLKKGQRVWKLSRVIWRAGAWRMREAADSIAGLCARLTDPMDLWCAAWALGRCGEARHAVAMDLLADRASDKKAWVRIMVAEARAALTPDDGSFEEKVAQSLPSSVGEAYSSGDPQAFRAVVEPFLRNIGDVEFPAKLLLLASRSSWVREIVHEMIRLLPVGRGTMPFFRQVLKASEFKLDAELYGQVIRRFDLSSPNSPLYDYRSRNAPKPAFMPNTRNYLRRRPMRFLKTAGESGEAALFVPLATGLLLAYDDSVDSPDETFIENWTYDRAARRSVQVRSYYPAHKQSLGFLWLLRGGLDAVELNPRQNSWRYAGGRRSELVGREEAFPELWDQAPDAIMHLLRHARSAVVQKFALRIWRANPVFLEEADISFIADLLGSWHAETSALGLEIAKARWNPGSPDLLLLHAMLASGLGEARVHGIAWLSACQSTATTDANFLASAAFLAHEDARIAVRDILRATRIDPQVQRDFTARVISALLAMDPEDAPQSGTAVDFLLLLAPDEVAALPVTHLAELAAHPLEACQLLAVQILLKRPSVSGLPENILLAALSSEFPAVRKLGMELLGKLSAHELAERTETLAACAVSTHPELREGAEPLLGRAAAYNREAARELVIQWYPLLFRAESFEGLHQSVYRLLSGPFVAELDVIPADSYPRMLESKYGYGQSLGFEILKRQTDNHDTEQLAEWAVHSLVALREWAFERLERSPQKLRDDPGMVLGLLESDFDDTRERAFAFCRREIRDGDWTPEALVAICDSNQQRVRDFGRELVTRLFQEQDGPLYLARFSQHPSTEIQLFATNYLERFASGSAERIASLDLYFRTVLSRIGAGRIAKQRVLAFLEREALAAEAIAGQVTPLLARQSGTVAIQDKAEMIRILDAIRRQWPAIPNPLKPVSVPIHVPS
ncbi:WGR domain-containing protein [Haloferula sp. BvORR071]|uniref:WGR domain-containing protein n=1 Tax=Haloferula sp. BvORR071 TaxID=1396141 RepID=UPI0005569CF3|nr:WGR domain-containing protein [Haloferula sp. BvORR071]